MAYKIFLFDNCCHIWISEDTGATWVEGCTPGNASTPAPNDPGLDPHGFGTILDDWSDGLMAINDGDYQTFVGIDFDYQDRFGIVGISPLGGLNGTWTLVDPEPDETAFIPDTANFQQYIRGACSGNAETILVCPRFYGSSPLIDVYPRITRDGGATWNDVTGGLFANDVWTHAAFGSTASQIMYLKAHPFFIWKSVDWGVTWTQLTDGPLLSGEVISEASSRLRCSADGHTVVMIGTRGVFWVSKDAGTSWNTFDFEALTPAGISWSDFADCAVTPDGNTIIVALNRNSVLAAGQWPAIFVSTDGGTSFADVAGGVEYPASAGPPADGEPTTTRVGVHQCGVAPDGLGMVVTLDKNDIGGPVFPDGLAGRILYANLSTDAGATWSLCTIEADPYEAASGLGLFTGAYIVGEPEPEPGCQTSGFDLRYPPCVTTWTQCVKIVRRDGIAFRFTSLDRDHEFRGETYLTCGGLDPSAMQTLAQVGEVGSSELGGLITATGVEESELYGGLFDDAFVEIWLVDYEGSERPRRLAAGWAGKITHSTRGYRMEVLGPGARLEQRPIVQVYSPQCRWVFGDERCGVDIEALAVSGAVTSGLNRGVYTATLGSAAASGTGAAASSGELTAQFSNGRVRWETGVNAGQVTEVKEVDFETGLITLWALTCNVPEAGDTFTLLPGCAQDFATCRDLYDNAVNFGGFPHVPGRDAITRAPDAKAAR